MNLPLTRKQREIHEYLQAHQYEFSERPPTLEQLCQHLGLKSRGSLHKHIHALIDAGLVEPIDGLHRGVRLCPDTTKKNSYELPFSGRIAAGFPIEAIEDSERIEVPPHLRTTKPCFVLQVVGDSMVEAGILDGDHVVIEKRSSAINSEIVVALIDGDDATLKTIEQRPEEVILHPSNSTMTAMHYRPEQVVIQGVLVGQMRSY
ncbi:MAG: repressor LexA [Gammaproteobacteria bacterium]|nr:repressor LexA [Gammaproteobacteria bacterium]